MTAERVILDSPRFSLTIERLCHQLIENHGDFSDVCLIGIQPRGIWLSERIQKRLSELVGESACSYGMLDPTFHRDDFRRSDRPLTPFETRIDFQIEHKQVVLIDDVFYTGRTIRAAMDALLNFGRADKIELLVMVDRRWSRHVPIQPDYVGQTIDSVTSEKVRVEWAERDGRDRIWIVSQEDQKDKNR